MVAEVRDQIAQLWHAESNVWSKLPTFSFASEDQYFAFCAAKDWIQDTSEALLAHRTSDFSLDPFKAYIEFWGVLQAVFIQQDAIKQFWYSLTGAHELNPKPSQESAWDEIRELRNLSVGHPTYNRHSKTAKAAKETARTVSGRQAKSYQHIQVSVYVAGNVLTKNVELEHVAFNSNHSLRR